MSDGRVFFKNAIALQISREMALDMGMVEPTAPEKRQRDADWAAYQSKKAAAQPRLREALAALDALDGLARDVLDLHAFDRTQPYSQTCDGCDFAGYEGDPPDWPCRTVDLIAERNGIDLRDFYLYDPEESA